MHVNPFFLRKLLLKQPAWGQLPWNSLPYVRFLLTENRRGRVSLLSLLNQQPLFSLVQQNITAKY